MNRNLGDRPFQKQTTWQMILQQIYRQGPISRADVSRATGMTAPTISDIVASLLADGLVEELGFGPSTGGKRPTLLRVVDDSRHLVGLDLGRGDFRGAVMNLRGEVRNRIDVPLMDRSGSAALALVFELVEQLIGSTDRPILGIGIGAPGLVDSDQGVVINAVNVEWKELPLADILKQKYQLPVYASNDCHVAALAEYLFGRSNHPETLVVINIGYGVGAGIVINGQLLRGSPTGAGEIGHLMVSSEGEHCQCGSRGCLETVVGSRGIARRAIQAGLNKSLVIGKENGDCLEFEVIKELCESKNAAAQKVVKETGYFLGIACASLVSVLGSCRILLAGQVTCFGNLLLDAVREELASRVKLPSGNMTEIGFVSIGSDIVLRGTSVLVLSKEMGL